MKRLFLLLTLLATAPCLRAEAVVTDVWAAQIPGTHQVRITYKLEAAVPCTVRVQAWLEVPGTSLVLPDASLSGDVTDEDGVKKISPGTGKSITLTVSRTTASGTTWLAPSLQNIFTKNLRFKVLATESSGPPTYGDMVRIEGGPFQMGDQSNPPVGWPEELPVHAVEVGTFYMGKYEVSWGLWKQVRDWGRGNGYELNDGGGKADDHPVHSITWYDMVKWCNARTEYENVTLGRTATVCYTVNGAVYRTGSYDAVEWNGNATGYRLPTEAEWEKAARGGLNGQNFPWGNEITYEHANCKFHPTYAIDGIPYTAPVNDFSPNGYGLFNMSGNVWEWCWDWYDNYTDNTQTNPTGALSGFKRVYRGGSWDNDTRHCRAAYRNISHSPSQPWSTLGFRAARSTAP